MGYLGSSSYTSLTAPAFDPSVQSPYHQAYPETDVFQDNVDYTQHFPKDYPSQVELSLFRYIILQETMESFAFPDEFDWWTFGDWSWFLVDLIDAALNVMICTAW